MAIAPAETSPPDEAYVAGQSYRPAPPRPVPVGRTAGEGVPQGVQQARAQAKP